MTAMMIAAELGKVNWGVWVVVAPLVLIGLVFLGLFLPLFGLWLQALAARAGVGWLSLIPAWISPRWNWRATSSPAGDP